MKFHSLLKKIADDLSNKEFNTILFIENLYKQNILFTADEIESIFFLQRMNFLDIIF